MRRKKATAELRSRAELGRLLSPEALRRIEAAGLTVSVRVHGKDGNGASSAALADILADLENGQAKLDALQTLAALGEMGAGVIHEARNVMTGVIGFAQVAVRRNDPLYQADVLERIERESVRCQGILQSFLSFARNDRNRLKVDLAALVDDTADLVRHRFKLRSVRLEVAHAKAPLCAAVRSGEIRQVLLNLLVNAEQALPRGGLVRVVTAPGPNGHVRVVVADNGPGIAEGLHTKIFDSFFTTKPPGVGTGLGLAICRKIVEGHGGTLTLEQGTGEGATFVVTLPKNSERDTREQKR